MAASREGDLGGVVEGEAGTEQYVRVIASQEETAENERSPLNQRGKETNRTIAAASGTRENSRSKEVGNL